jgi:hypothetical protein
VGHGTYQLRLITAPDPLRNFEEKANNANALFFVS